MAQIKNKNAKFKATTQKSKTETYRLIRLLSANNLFFTFDSKMFSNPTTYDIRAMSDKRRATINMQNKANLERGQMNISSFITSRYEDLDIWRLGKNKANQSQFWRQ